VLDTGRGLPLCIVVGPKLIGDHHSRRSPCLFNSLRIRRLAAFALRRLKDKLEDRFTLPSAGSEQCRQRGRRASLGAGTNAPASSSIAVARANPPSLIRSFVALRTRSRDALPATTTVTRVEGEMVMNILPKPCHPSE
jgi:hypothetical protein